MKYTVTNGFLVLDENSNVIDWFDTEEEANEYVENLESEAE